MNNLGRGKKLLPLLQNIHTSSETHPTSYSEGNGDPSQG